MNKAKQIAFYKRQLDTAETLKAAGAQLTAEATHIESEAKRALELLGSNSGRTRKGKSSLSQAAILKLKAGMTPVTESN